MCQPTTSDLGAYPFVNINLWHLGSKGNGSTTSGRWFLFSLAMDSVIVLEKKDVPEHLLEMNALDRPTFLKKVLAELEDLGEASQTNTLCLAAALSKLI